MPASSSDLVRNAAPNFATTLANSMLISDNSMTLSSVTGLPTATGITLVIDATDPVSGASTPALKEVVTGVVSGGTVASLTRGLDGTSAQAHASGANVVMWITANLWNDFQQSYLVGHSQAGAHNMTSPQITTGIFDTNNKEIIGLTPASSAVNEINITNAATAAAPIISAVGSDTNIGININGKGSGAVSLNGAGVPAAGFVNTAETSTSTSYADLATTTDSVTVTVGTDGLLLVSIYATGSNSGTDAQTFTSFALSGANTLAANDVNAVLLRLTTATASQAAGITKLLTGLSPGSTTVKMKYRVTGNTGTWSNRNVSAVPL